MNTKRIIAAIAGIALVAVTGFICYQLGAQSTQKLTDSTAAKQLASRFFTDLASGSTSSAYRLGSELYKAKNTESAIKELSDELQSDGDIRLSNEEIYFGRDTESNQARYTAFVDNLPVSPRTGRTSANIVVRLVYEGGIWRIDSLEVR